MICSLRLVDLLNFKVRCIISYVCTQDYLRKLDPATNVGLSTDSIVHYAVGEVYRRIGKGDRLELFICLYLYPYKLIT